MDEIAYLQVFAPFFLQSASLSRRDLSRDTLFPVCFDFMVAGTSVLELISGRTLEPN